MYKWYDYLWQQQKRHRVKDYKPNAKVAYWENKKFKKGKFNLNWIERNIFFSSFVQEQTTKIERSDNDRNNLKKERKKNI